MSTQYKRIDDNGLLYILQLLKPIISASGEENVIEVIQKNGVALTINNKTVNIDWLIAKIDYELSQSTLSRYTTTTGKQINI